MPAHNPHDGIHCSYNNEPSTQWNVVSFCFGLFNQRTCGYRRRRYQIGGSEIFILYRRKRMMTMVVTAFYLNEWFPFLSATSDRNAHFVQNVGYHGCVSWGTIAQRSIKRSYRICYGIFDTQPGIITMQCCILSGWHDNVMSQQRKQCPWYKQQSAKNRLRSFSP